MTAYMQAITLRDYQSQLVDNIRQQLRQGLMCVLVRLACGGGKTVIFCYITAGAASKGKSVLLVAHRRELINQISLSLARFGVMHRIVAPSDVARAIKIAHFKAYGRSFVDPTSRTIVGSVQTLVGRLDTIKDVDIIVQDEGHHCIEGTMWGKVREAYPSAIVMKFTATPIRLEGRGLGEGEGGYAQTLIEGPPESWLIENGFLSQYRLFTSKIMPDLKNLKHKKNGEYSDKSLDEELRKPKIIEGAVQQWIEKAENRLTVAYCVSRKASDALAAEFRAHGIPAEHFDSETEASERVRIVNDFADGKIRVLCNVGLLTEGFDLASIVQRDVQIDCVLDVAPTESLSLYLQKVMRCMRPRPGKLAIILDAAGNCGRVIDGVFVPKHGFPCDDREWTLQGVKRLTRAANDNTRPVIAKACPACMTQIDTPVCGNCGYVSPVKSREVETINGDLVELSEFQRQQAKAIAEEAKRLAQIERKREQAGAQTVEELTELGRKRGYAYPRQWAERLFASRQKRRA